jgi:two-component system, NarL family, nitrate/nitrite response regulator NarL
VSLTCVLVDDSADFLRSAARLLEAEGMQVVGQARTGDEAERILERTSPDVILVDVELGDEDGVEVAATLAGRAPTAVVVLISSRDQDELRDTLDRGPDQIVRYLAKDALSTAAITRLM